MAATRLPQLNAWAQTVSNALPCLSRPQANVLAQWSFAAVVIQSAASSSCALFLAGLCSEGFEAVLKRLRECYKPATAKRGDQRREIEVSLCFAPLLAWVASLHRGETITLALDASLCRARFACLCISVVFEGGALPVAWKIVEANKKGAWMKHWTPMLRRLKQGLPSDMEALVVADRGLYSRRLFHGVRRLGLHVLLRINKGAYVCPDGQRRWQHLETLLPEAGTYYLQRGTVFKTKGARLQCTFLAVWEAGYDEPWFLVTDLRLSAYETSYYGLRAWIEQGFRTIKSGGLAWERSRLSSADRMERLWLVYALSSIHIQSLSGGLTPQTSPWPDLRRFWDGPKRIFSRFRLGTIYLLILLVRQEALPSPTVLRPDAVPIVKGCRRVQLLKEQQT